VALALAAAALFPEREPAPCKAPRELAAAAGWTREVGCEERVGAAPLRGPARLLYGERIDPNRADAATLEALPGIGAGRAAALVEAREHRTFCRADDLESVKGIGPKTRRALEPWLAFADPSCGSPPHVPREAQK
jgi:competence protein ComEA